MAGEAQAHEPFLIGDLCHFFEQLNPLQIILDQIIIGRQYRVLQTAKRGDRIKLPRGLWLIKKYKRKKHTIRCLESCYLYQDNYYKSLTEIARLITGTDVSGPSFFKRSTEIIMDHR
ncbi:MAG: hypothetical protein CL570_05505 [Alphaproteobacteria bacterium]|nr:hypothetical protein [Alphaproteobacteria bacterium]